MNRLYLKVVTPDKLFFEGEIDMLVARTIEGDVGILLNHSPTTCGSKILDVESSGSTAGYIPNSEIERERTVVASRWVNVVAGAGSVKSSAGT